VVVAVHSRLVPRCRARVANLPRYTDADERFEYTVYSRARDLVQFLAHGVEHIICGWMIGPTGQLLQNQPPLHSERQ
jgi:hypothetical protein